MNKPTRICSIADCGRKHYSRGWCIRHYYRWKTHGDPMGKYPLVGDPWRYMMDHMWDDCPKWPFGKTSAGYGQVRQNGKQRRVHRIVCEMVHGPAPTPTHHAAHNCGKGHEGCFGARCLAWKTPTDNMRDKSKHGTLRHGCDNPRNILTEEDVHHIRELSKSGGSARKVAEQFGVSRGTIRDIIKGRSWTHLPVRESADV